MRKVMLLAGAGQIGMAIARRMGAGMKIVVGDKKMENAQAIAGTMNEAGFDAVPMEMDLYSRESIRALIAEELPIVDFHRAEMNLEKVFMEVTQNA